MKLIASGDLSLILIISAGTMIYLVIDIYLIARRNFFLKIGKFDVGKYIRIMYRGGIILNLFSFLLFDFSC